MNVDQRPMPYDWRTELERQLGEERRYLVQVRVEYAAALDRERLLLIALEKLTEAR
jgi:hypothetical protein